MSNVTVSGLPGNSNLHNVLHILRPVVGKCGIQKFWVRELSDIPGEDTKQATIEFKNSYEAARACDELHTHEFQFNRGHYTLIAYTERAMSPYRERSPRRRSPSPYYDRYSSYDDFNREPRGRYNGRDRYRSPDHRDDTSKLDAEIELLRKQRIIIEEERKLLLEKKKLELVREFGPSAAKELDLMDSESRDRDYYRRPRREYYEERRPRPIRNNYKPKKAYAPKKQGLPLFVLPCKKLIDEMKPLIEEGTTENEIETLVRLIRFVLRKRMAVALEHNPNRMNSAEIIKLYRKLYPACTDKDLVAKHLGKIRKGENTDDNFEEEPVKGDDETGEESKGVSAESSDLNDRDNEVIDQDAIDKEKLSDLNECILSLDANEIDEVLNMDNNDWNEGGTDWN